ncbi:MAG: hypothetical protein IJ733_16310 [Lachnospiraceae bacterium]|nr:hypothetical protein [Lachnospiraceae bacterium]
MKNIFDILPMDFFKPLTSKYKRIYADTILLIFNTFKPEISYGVNREIVVKVLMDYFEADDDEMSFDEETYVSDSREKANGVIAQLKAAGWLEYEQAANHQLNVTLFDYTIPVIESMNRVIKEEETEYQGIISQIHASLQNEELYAKPYELIIMGVGENTERLVSELKKLNVSIKRHMEKQTNDMEAAEVLEHFFKYHQDIGSKAYLRMKTGDNISYFRNAIIDRIDYILESAEIMDRALSGYMEIKHVEDEELAYDSLVRELMDIKSAFYRLDDIIEEIDNKHRRYMRNAVMRARFLLSTGNNLEGKLSKILNQISEEINRNSESVHADLDETEENLFISMFPQNYISPESLKTIPVKKKNADIEQIRKTEVLSAKERELYKEALRNRNRNRFSRKNINQFVIGLLGEKEKMPVTDISVESKRDLIRIIYISLYAGNRANNYRIKRSKERVKIGEYELPYFEILKC